MEKRRKHDLIRPAKDEPIIIGDPDIVRRKTDVPFANLSSGEIRAADSAVESVQDEPIDATDLFAGAGKPTAELRACSGWPSFTDPLSGEDPYGNSIENPVD